MKEHLKKIPLIGKMLKLLNRTFKHLKFKNSTNYWESRYAKGGNSGSGSYDHLAEFKAEVINEFINENKINTVIELGSGDGNQLKYAKYSNYIGFDVSETALKLARIKFKDNAQYQFKHINDISNHSASLTISLDVIYHLVEDNIFNEYMENLFNSSLKYVIIYSSNQNECIGDDSIHVKHRKFTDWVEINKPDWVLIKHIPNKYPYDGDYITSSFADFYIYEKN
jgi:hypothetical protein